jgi:hypothetical protein
MILSVEGLGAKLGVGMGALDFQPNVIRPLDFWPNDIVSCIYDFLPRI